MDVVFFFGIFRESVGIDAAIRCESLQCVSEYCREYLGATVAACKLFSSTFQWKIG